jgi:uncharacterized protein
MHNRIIGFDMARAYAIFGMFVVNFNTVFGSHTNKEGLSGFLNLFNGNSSSVFVILAGMGIALMTGKANLATEEKRRLRHIITKRSWFLFVTGILLYLWWPADILHFYGGYMHIAVILMFLPRKYFLIAALTAILIFHILLDIIPYQRGWNFDSFQYIDFWTVPGFLRNTFYNGWNPVFPWIAYFFLGMYLGRLNWQEKKLPKKVFIAGAIVYLSIWMLQTFGEKITNDPELLFYLNADYLPPFLPFMLSTAGFGLMLISLFILLGKQFEQTRLAQVLAATGQMTLTHYVTHLFAGLFLVSVVTGRTLSYDLLKEQPSDPLVILMAAIVYFSLSCLFSYLWKKKYRNGPLEMLMRRISG